MSFTSELDKWCKVTKPNHLMDTVRKAIMEIGTRVVYRSPVGNPSLWQEGFRETATGLGWVGAGYTGGRFRANWQYGFGVAPDGDIDEIDKSGAETIGKINNSVMVTDVIGINYLVNNQPYGERLENGYSKQAPQGMVGLVELEFPEIMQKAQL